MWGILRNDRAGVSRYGIGVRARRMYFILLLSYFRKISGNFMDLFDERA